jgi:hypothetical protein
MPPTTQLTLSATSSIASQVETSTSANATAGVVTETLASTNATAGVVTPSIDAELLDDNAALIGGVVGGVVALLLLGGLIACAFVVACRRRGNGAPIRNNDAALQSVRESVTKNDMRDALTVSHRSDYDALTLSPPTSNYGMISVKEDTYATLSTNRTEYEQGDLTNFI